MSAAPTLIRAMLEEHGDDPTQPDGLAWILRGEAGRSPLPAITTDSEYVRAVRRILRRPSRDVEAHAVLGAWQPMLFESMRAEAQAGGVDWRLLVCGWQLGLAPSVWVEKLPSFLRYWGRAVLRPGRVGSSYNPAPLDVARAWLLRLPVHGGPAVVAIATEYRHGLGRARVTTDRRKLVDAARALGRASARRRHPTLGPREAAPWAGPWALERLSVSALAALGRLTPQLQAAAIDRMMADDPHPDGLTAQREVAPRIGRAAIPWDHIAAERARGERYLAARYLRGRALCAAMGVAALGVDDAARVGVETARSREWAADPAALVAALAPGWTAGDAWGRQPVTVARRVLAPCWTAGWTAGDAWGRQPVTVARRLAAGETVAAVAASLCEEDGLAVDVPLTRREAHAVVVGALCGRRGPRVILWMATGAASGTGHRVSSVAATRWLAAVASDPERIDALMRERTERVPLHLAPPGWHGEADGDHVIARWSYDARIDELRAADLPDGPRTGVERAMRLLAERTARERMRDTPEGKRQLASPPPWWQPVPGVRLLDSAHALWLEGEELAHCVAGYVGAVQACRSVIVGLQAQDGSRSTVELDRLTKSVIQHRGWRNGTPSAACERLLGAMLVAWRVRP